MELKASRNQYQEPFSLLSKTISPETLEEHKAELSSMDDAGGLQEQC